ncbi:MAG TPA: hypothetical protein VEJ47_04475 [Candidatus Eremiobacteraceae bacterium]|nr:hypothetical protein [Candidatus Eremiobacteraceae bacterium]
MEQIQLLGRYGIWGMKSSAALAVKTTFLHFVAPTINPIFDKQVLLAVGVKERNANQKIELLQPYASQAKMLAEKYSQDLKLFSCESPIRLIDMALWVIRGTRISTPAESTDRRSSRRAIT